MDVEAGVLEWLLAWTGEGRWDPDGVRDERTAWA